MTEATGKGICMFASKNTLTMRTNILAWQFLFCISLWTVSSLAQQVDEQPDPAMVSGEPAAADQHSTGNRRIERMGETSTDEWELDLALPYAVTGISSADEDFSLPDATQDLKLQQLLNDLARNPSNKAIVTELNAMLVVLLDQADTLMDGRNLVEAVQILAVIRSIEPNLPGFRSAQQKMLRLLEADELVTTGNNMFESQRLIEPEGNNAVYFFNLALSKDSQNLSAQSGLARVQESLVQRALDSARELDFEMAEEWLKEASGVLEDQTLVEDGRSEMTAFRKEYAKQLEQNAIDAMDSGNFTLADFNIIDLIAFGGEEARVEYLRSRLDDARYYGGFQPGQIISDTFLYSEHKAPDIIIIASGSFLLGSDENSALAQDNEQPRHRVTMEHGFGMGVKEVTVGEFRLFVDRSKYKTAAELDGKSSVYDETVGRLNSRLGADWEYDYRGKKAKEDMPVMHVNWYDAQSYVQWLAKETGKRYRLPSEAEYEYVARAGGNKTYWWGEGTPPEVVENLTGERDSSPSKRIWGISFKRYGDAHWGPAPSGSFIANPMGVHDISGNLSEWAEDCWHQNYVMAPVDGSAWVNPGCSRRVVRGGHWASAPDKTRAAYRISAKPDTYGPIVGIRIARDL